ncbi:MAG: 4Fe-4S binding protein [Anaerolineaceae bacterium]
MNLFDAAERFASIDPAQVHLDSGCCLYSRDQNSNCSNCFDICPEGAIQPGKPPVLNPEVCKSCMACLPVCPVGAYQAEDRASNLYTCVSRIEGTSVELICGLHPLPQTGADAATTAVQIQTCLASLGVGIYAGLTALGLEHILVRTDACAQCPWQSLKPAIQKQVEKAQGFLAGWEKPKEIRCVDHLDQPVERPLLQAKTPPMTRRDLFRMAALQTKAALARELNPGVMDEKQHINPDRLRLTAAVSRLGDPESADRTALEGLEFATLTVADTCTACGACARACPSNALRLYVNESETRFALALEPRLCMGCEVCVQVCAPAAITVNQEPVYQEAFPSNVVALQSGELSKCQRCGTRMVKRSGVTLCPMCEFRRKNPFKQAAPPGIKPLHR